MALTNKRFEMFWGGGDREREQSAAAGFDIKTFFVQNLDAETRKMRSFLFSRIKNTHDSARILSELLPKKQSE